MKTTGEAVSHLRRAPEAARLGVILPPCKGGRVSEREWVFGGEHTTCCRECGGGGGGPVTGHPLMALPSRY